MWAEISDHMSCNKYSGKTSNILKGKMFESTLSMQAYTHIR